MSQPQDKLFPVFLNLSGRSVLVVGAGSVALQKLQQLISTGAQIIIIAVSVQDTVRQLANENTDRVTLLERPVALDDLANRDLIIAATNDSALNRQLVDEARHRGIWINAVDDPGNCDFFTAAVIDKGPIRIAISSEGRFPGFVTALRKTLQQALPDEHLGSVDELGQLRDRFKQEYNDPAERGRILKGICADIERQYFKLPAVAERIGS